MFDNQLTRNQLRAAYVEGRRDFSYTVFEDEIISGLVMEGCNFRGASFKSCSVYDNSFKNCIFEGVSWGHAQLMGNDFAGSIFESDDRWSIGWILYNAANGDYKKQMLAFSVMMQDGFCWGDHSSALKKAGLNDLRHWAAKVLFEFDCFKWPIRHHGSDLVVMEEVIRLKTMGEVEKQLEAEAEEESPF